LHSQWKCTFIIKSFIWQAFASLAHQ